MTSKAKQTVFAFLAAFVVACDDEPLVPIGSEGSEPSNDEPTVEQPTPPPPPLPNEEQDNEPPQQPECQPVPGIGSDAACEPDADWCDPLGDGAEPASADLRATWSFVDGEDFVVQAMFAAMPYQADVGQDVVIAFVDTALDATCIVGNFEDVDGVLSHTTCLVVGQEPPYSHGRTEYFPPSLFEPAPEWTNEMEPYRCDVRLHPSQPVAEWRFPLALVSRSDGTVAYAVESTCSVTVVDCLPFDLSWAGASADPVLSAGGRFDDSDNLMSTCDIPCPTTATTP